MNKGPERRNSSGMPQPAGEGGGQRSGQACVCLITCLLFLLLLAGGVFLVMFISQPASSTPPWLLPAGMVLVASPWIFWIFTCFYRCISVRVNYGGGKIGAEDRQSSQRQVTRQPTVVVATDPPPQQAVEAEAVESPGGARKVRFGNATVLGTISDDGDEETASELHTGPSGTAEVEGSRDAGESSIASRESEKPLALSMSS